MTAAPPTWDMTPYFDALLSPAYAAYTDGLNADLASLLARGQSLPALDAAAPDTLTALADFINAMEAVYVRAGHLMSYLGCLGAADATNEDIQREQALADQRYASLEKCDTLLRQALRPIDDPTFDALKALPALDGVGWMLDQARADARFTMPDQLELLAADLGVTGIHAWGNLYQQLTGTLTFTLAPADQDPKEVPFAWTRSLLEDPSPEVRRAALRGANAAIEARKETFTAALNAISGTRLTLYKWRGVPHYLDVALRESSITQKTLDAMMGAIEQRKDLPQRYLLHKAALMGKDRLGFQDLMAPLPLARQRDPLPWADAERWISTAFHQYHPDLGAFADRAFSQRWIDAEPRPGKRPGGFCTSSKALNQSRIFMTYRGTLGDVQTLAHELGHAFHNWAMNDLRPLRRRYPMTLAETASTFAENVLTDHLLSTHADDPTTTAQILDTRLEAASAFLLNIPMRYDFERALYDARAAGEVSTSQMQAMMTTAQQRWFGPCLDPDAFDPWFWASKLHFYITYVSFYNFPYAFGYLFSNGVFARAKAAGPSFFPTYVKLLRETGDGMAEAVARRVLDIDLEDTAFWLSSIDLVAQDLTRFEALLPTLRAQQAPAP
jgi:oligoendopeptidase F